MDPTGNDLPKAYDLALRLRRDGMTEAGIAERIGIEPEAVPSLLRLAEAKLDRTRTASARNAMQYGKPTHEDG